MTSPPRTRTLSRAQGIMILARRRLGHLVLARRAQVDVVPIRFVVMGGWLYFGAGGALRTAIGHNAWVAVVIGAQTSRGWASVVARGACYATDRTGSHASDAEARRGIAALRKAAAKRTGGRPASGASVVFRMDLEELRGRLIRR